jgi:carboxyl-terminal processing protease
LRRRLLAGALLAAGSLSEVAAVGAPVANPWLATGLDFSFIERRVRTDACYRSETRFLSCMNAIQRLLERGPRRVRMALSGDLRPDDTARIRQRFGPVVLVEVSPAQSAGPAIARELRARRARIAAWRALYQARPRQEIDFSKLREWLVSEIVEPEYSAAYAAAAINGYLSIEDAHARIMPAQLIQGDMETGTPGNGKPGTGTTYTGIGVALELIGGMAVVTGVIPGGPAERAGVRMQDVLLAVDGEPLAGSMEETLDRLRGPEGTRLMLQFRRGGVRHAARVVREEITLKNVMSSVLEDGGSDWGYLRVHSFVAPDTCSEVRRELDHLLAAQVSGLILDVRDNAGGRIDQAVCVADLFLGPNLVVLEMRSTLEQGRSRKMRTRFWTRTSLPLVTLINAGTGSASELLAGALRDHGRSVLVGERTFGKGTIQTPRPWGRSGSVMKFTTTAHYYLPSGSSVQRVGLEPDIRVPRPTGAAGDERLVLRLEDLYPTSPPAGSTAPLHRAAPSAGACSSGTPASVPDPVSDSVQADLGDHILYRASALLNCML